jgi:hypothetical protein
MFLFSSSVYAYVVLLCVALVVLTFFVVSAVFFSVPCLFGCGFPCFFSVLPCTHLGGGVVESWPWVEYFVCWCHCAPCYF